VDRVKDHIFAIPASGVAGNDIAATANCDLIDIAPHQDLALAVGSDAGGGRIVR